MQRKTNKKRLLRLPLHVYLVYLLAVTLIFTGVTFSKYIASTTAGDSARVASFGNLELYELGLNGEKIPESDAFFEVAPGVNIFKKPVIDFSAEENENSEMAAYIFVKVGAQGWGFEDKTAADSADTEIYGPYVYTAGIKDGAAMLNWEIADGWRLLKDESGNQVFFRVLGANEKLVQADIMKPADEKGNTIRVSAEIYSSELEGLKLNEKPVSFQGCAVQRHGFPSADEAWLALEGK